MHLSRLLRNLWRKNLDSPTDQAAFAVSYILQTISICLKWTNSAPSKHIKSSDNLWTTVTGTIAADTHSESFRIVSLWQV